MKTVLAYPGNMAHAQQAALAMLEADSLAAYVTTFAFRPDGRFASLLSHVPSARARGLLRQLARRSIDQVPAELVRSYPSGEILRSIAEKAGATRVAVDGLWERSVHSFDRLVARRYVPTVQAVQSFEYTALATFERARKEGVGAILHLPSLDNAQFRDIEARERRKWKAPADADAAYFEQKFPRRQERRRREMALADVIITNSSLTARSHIAAGADPAKVFAVGLAAPPPIAEVKTSAPRRDRPLRVLYAGRFSLGKGAPYLLKAWSDLNAGAAAVLDVYGSVDLPEHLLAAGGASGIVFHGAVPQPALYEAYEAADVLVFPTLWDGFGMVVAEAMAHGLPVITTDQAGAADLVTPDSGTVVPAGDAKALADALRWCLDNRDRLHEMRAHALAAARRRQWPDYRRDLRAAIETGLRTKGFEPALCRLH